MALISDNTSSLNPKVTFTGAKMVYHLGGTLDCARRENDRIILQNNALEKEVIELRLVHINKDKLKEDVDFIYNRVNCYKKLEINLKEIINGLETKVRGYYNSSVKDKDIFNHQAISQTVGIGYDYNEAIGKLRINSPNRVSDEERGIPHVLKGVNKPLFRKSIAKPLNETSIFIQEEMRIEDIVNKNVMSNKYVPTSLIKVVHTMETNFDTHKLEQKDNMSNMHNIPSIDLSHKACGVANYMSCAFNDMFVYFNSKHASNVKTAPRQHLNNKKRVKTKTASSLKVRVETFIPKPKKNFVKVVYKVKCPVVEKVDVVKIKNVVLPNKGQFFKYIGPNQVCVPKKVYSV